MKITSKVLYTFLALSIISCSSSDDSETTGSCEFDIPFAVEGNKWTLDVSTFGVSQGQLEVEIGACGSSGLSVVITGPTGSITNRWKQEDGYLWTDANDAENGFNRFYKKNAIVGDVFSYTRNSGATSEREVIAVDSMITVPAGTFACDVYRIVRSDVINETISMWNHDVGEIKSDSGFSIIELASYDFN